MKNYKSLLLVVIAMLPILGCKQWIKFESKEANFRIEFPGEPRDMIGPAGPGGEYLFTYTEGNSLGYAIHVSDYATGSTIKSNPVIARRYLSSIINSSIAGIEGPLTNVKDIDLGKYPGIETTSELSSPDGPMIVYTRAYLVKNRMYMIQVGQKKEEKDPVAVAKFFNSFSLLDEK